MGVARVKHSIVLPWLADKSFTADQSQAAVLFQVFAVCMTGIVIVPLCLVTVIPNPFLRCLAKGLPVGLAFPALRKHAYSNKLKIYRTKTESIFLLKT